MAKVYDEVFLNFGITDAIIDLLNGYDFWDHVVHNKPITFNTSISPYTVFYLDTAETVGIAVGESEVTEEGQTRSYSILFLTNNTFDINSDRLDAEYQEGRLYAVENNTGLYICAMSGAGTITRIPNGFFIAQAVSQDGRNHTQNVAGRFYGTGEYIDTDTKTIQFIGYKIYVTGNIEDEGVSIARDYNAHYDQEYNCLLPLVGADVGVPAGIYYPLMLEGDYKEVGPLRMNGKTFYLCGNAAVIDYYNQ